MLSLIWGVWGKVYTMLQTYVILFIFPLLLMPSGPFYFKSAAEHEDDVFLRWVQDLFVSDNS